MLHYLGLLWRSPSASGTIQFFVSVILQIRSLVDSYHYEEDPPDFNTYFCKCYAQGGSNANVLILGVYLNVKPSENDDSQRIVVHKDYIFDIPPANSSD